MIGESIFLVNTLLISTKMGKLKEHYHDEITRGLHMIPEDVEQYEADRLEAEKEHIEEVILEEERYDQLAEENRFFESFAITGHYPM